MALRMPEPSIKCIGGKACALMGRNHDILSLFCSLVAAAQPRTLVAHNKHVRAVGISYLVFAANTDTFWAGHSTNCRTSYANARRQCHGDGYLIVGVGLVGVPSNIHYVGRWHKTLFHVSSIMTYLDFARDNPLFTLRNC